MKKIILLSLAFINFFHVTTVFALPCTAEIDIVVFKRRGPGSDTCPACDSLIEDLENTNPPFVDPDGVPFTFACVNLAIVTNVYNENNEIIDQEITESPNEHPIPIPPTPNCDQYPMAVSNTEMSNGRSCQRTGCGRGDSLNVVTYSGSCSKKSAAQAAQ